MSVGGWFIWWFGGFFAGASCAAILVFKDAFRASLGDDYRE